MIDHCGIVVSDFGAARRFYDAVAEALGLQTKDGAGPFFFLARSAEEFVPYVWIGTIRPSYWAEGSRPGLNQMHVALQARDRVAVAAFHRAAIAAGGRDNGAPGPRDYAPGYYAAFVLDPDGNNIEACLHEATGG